MPMIKKSEQIIPVETPKKESGIEAAIGRLTTQSPVEKAETWIEKAYKPRDFDAEARGKTRCVMYAAALQSMAVAGTKWKNLDDLKKIIRELADDGVKYSFQD